MSDDKEIPFKNWIEFAQQNNATISHFVGELFRAVGHFYSDVIHRKLHKELNDHTTISYEYDDNKYLVDIAISVKRVD